MKEIRRAGLVAILSVCILCSVLAQALPGEGAAKENVPLRVALVLSGGSAFGMAHVGVIKVLEEAGIPIDMVMGTSMGSIVSGLYAAGYSPDQMRHIVTNIDWNAVFMDRKASAGDRYDFQKRTGYAGRLGFDSGKLAIGEGLFEGQNVLALFTELTLHSLSTRDFDKLPVPYRAVAADIWSGDKIVFSGGSLAEAMRSSMSIPGVFKPYVMEGRHIVDGGIVDNLPTDLARDLGADIIIAVESRGASPKGPESLDNALSIAGQTAGLFIQQNMKPSRQLADILIVPDLSAYTTASYGEAAAIIEAGERGARAALPDLRAIVDRIAASRPLIIPENQPNRTAYREPPRFSSIRVEGGTEADASFALAAFAGLVGSSPSRKDVRAAIDAVYTSGRFELVKLDLAPDGPDSATAIISLRPTTVPRNAILVNYGLDGIVSSSSSVDSEISAGLLFRAITSTHSALFLKTSLGRGFGAYGEFFQPIGPFFLMPWARYALENDEFAFSEYSVKISTVYRHFGGGIWAGLALGKHTDFRLGGSFEMIADGSRATPPADERLVALRSAFRLDNRGMTVFPESGVSLLAYGCWSDPILSSQLSFAQAELDFEAAISFDPKTALGIAAFAGSDFSGLIPGATAVDSSRYYTLARQGMFYGLNATEPDAMGNSVFGLGLEVRRKIAQINPILGGDVFLLANASIGSADWTKDATVNFLPLRYSGTLGGGLRLTGDFGVFAGAGIVGVSGSIRPALSVMIGSFENNLEDRR